MSLPALLLAVSNVQIHAIADRIHCPEKEIHAMPEHMNPSRDPIRSRPEQIKATADRF
jgi:hypothetical protein